MRELFFIVITTLLLAGCVIPTYGVNAETSEIGSMSPRCLDSLAWDIICAEHSIDNITNPELLLKLNDVKNHFIEPDYILYFKDGPEEIIGCDWYSIRVVYNYNIANQTLTGLSPLLSNKEQKRIRNRVFKELMKHQCEEGKKETLKNMERDVPYAESHKHYPLKIKPEMMAPAGDPRVMMEPTIEEK